MKSPILAGLIAAVPLAAVLCIYVLVRSRALAKFFLEQSDTPSTMSEKTMFWLLLAGFVGMALVFGALSGLVFGWLGMPRFAYVAIGATALFSVLAIISKQPLPWDKIVMNLAVGGVLGALIPLLVR